MATENNYVNREASDKLYDVLGSKVGSFSKDGFYNALLDDNRFNDIVSSLKVSDKTRQAVIDKLRAPSEIEEQTDKAVNGILDNLHGSNSQASTQRKNDIVNGQLSPKGNKVEIQSELPEIKPYEPINGNRTLFTNNGFTKIKQDAGGGFGIINPYVGTESEVKKSSIKPDWMTDEEYANIENLYGDDTEFKSAIKSLDDAHKNWGEINKVPLREEVEQKIKSVQKEIEDTGTLSYNQVGSSITGFVQYGNVKRKKELNDKLAMYQNQLRLIDQINNIRSIGKDDTKWQQFKKGAVDERNAEDWITFGLNQIKYDKNTKALYDKALNGEKLSNDELQTMMLVSNLTELKENAPEAYAWGGRFTNTAAFCADLALTTILTGGTGGALSAANKLFKVGAAGARKMALRRMGAAAVYNMAVTPINPMLYRELSNETLSQYQFGGVGYDDRQFKPILKKNQKSNAEIAYRAMAKTFSESYTESLGAIFLPEGFALKLLNKSKLGVKAADYLRQSMPNLNIFLSKMGRGWDKFNKYARISSIPGEIGEEVFNIPFQSLLLWEDQFHDDEGNFILIDPKFYLEIALDTALLGGIGGAVGGARASASTVANRVKINKDFRKLGTMLNSYNTSTPVSVEQLKAQSESLGRTIDALKQREATPEEIYGFQSRKAALDNMIAGMENAGESYIPVNDDVVAGMDNVRNIILGGRMDKDRARAAYAELEKIPANPGTYEFLGVADAYIQTALKREGLIAGLTCEMETDLGKMAYKNDDYQTVVTVTLGDGSQWYMLESDEDAFAVTLRSVDNPSDRKEVHPDDIRTRKVERVEDKIAEWLATSRVTVNGGGMVEVVEGVTSAPYEVGADTSELDGGKEGNDGNVDFAPGGRVSYGGTTYIVDSVGDGTLVVRTENGEVVSIPLDSDEVTKLSDEENAVIDKAEGKKSLEVGQKVRIKDDEDEYIIQSIDGTGNMTVRSAEGGAIMSISEDDIVTDESVPVENPVGPTELVAPEGNGGAAIVPETPKPQFESGKVSERISKKWMDAPKEFGFEDRQYVGKKPYNVRYVLTEQGAVTPSHDWHTFKPIDDFIKTASGENANSRAYEQPSKRAAVESRAKGYNGRAFQDPVFVKDGAVISGNGRTMSGYLAMEGGTDKQYIDDLKHAARKFGFTTEQVEQFKNPRVYAEIIDDIELNSDLFDAFNKPTTEGESMIDRAIAFSKKKDNPVIDKLIFEVSKYATLSELYNNPASSKVIKDMLISSGFLNENQVPTYFNTAEGKFTAEGKALLESVLNGCVLDTKHIMLLNSDGMGNVRTRIARCAPLIMKNLSLGKDVSLEKNINNAIEYVNSAKPNGVNIFGLVMTMRDDNNNIFDNVVYDDMSTLIAIKLLDSDESFREFLNSYNKFAAENSGIDSMFGDEFNPMDKYDEAVRKIQEELNNLGDTEKDEKRRKQLEAQLAAIAESKISQRGNTDEVGGGDVQSGAETSAGTDNTGKEKPSEQSEVTETEPQPVQGEIEPESDAFGTIFRQFKGKAKEAIDFLLNRKEGKAVAALNHPEVGDIDIWYGNDKAGLKKIAQKHSSILDNIQDKLNNMKVVQRSDNRIILDGEGYRAVISKMLGDKKTDNWLLSAYEKNDSPASSSDIETGSNESGNGTAAPRTDVSVDKGNESSETTSASEEKPKNPSGNKIFTDEQFEQDCADFLKEIGNITEGPNPKAMLLATRICGYYVEKGLRKFADVAKAAYQKLGDAILPYIKGAYMAVKHYQGMEQYRKEMDSEDTVDEFDLNSITQKEEEPGNIQEESVSFVDSNVSAEENNARVKFMTGVYKILVDSLGKSEKPFKSINDLRKLAREYGMSVDENGKTDILIQELVEAAIVKASERVLSPYRLRDLLNKSKTAYGKEAFDKICELYDMQPTISMRSSERVRLQQYSTPIPMAFIADKFAYGYDKKSVFEPTAGNGMLVFSIPKQNVSVNEIDGNRLNNLRALGYDKITNQDATIPFQFGRVFDSIIVNPPFGSMEAKDYDGVSISGLDPQITLNALSQMKPDGRAAIIIGGNLEYNTNGSIKTKKAFISYLYDHYNVKGIVEMGGDLYKKQGTSYPTMMILIDGVRSEEERAKGRVYPPVQKNAVKPVTTFDELYDTVENLINSYRKTNGNEVLRSEGSESAPVSDNTHGNTDKEGRPGKSDKGDETVTGVRGGLESGSGSELVSDTGNGNSDNGGYSGERGQDVSDGGRTAGQNGPREQGGNGGESVGDGRGTQSTGRGADGNTVGGKGELDNGENNSGGTSDAGKSGLLRETEHRKLGQDKMAYVHHSDVGINLQSVAPAAMVEAMDGFLTKIESEYGDIDDFVTRELGYSNKEELGKCLAKEQVDGVAMAIYQMKNGSGMIIGDQTGVGKGRQMAALIRWAVRNGKKPIFFTQKASLFSDIYRDLSDIGSGNLRPFIFNDSKDAEVTDQNTGAVIYQHPSAKKFSSILESGVLPKEYDYALITYSQVNTGDAQSRTEAKEEAGKTKKSTSVNTKGSSRNEKKAKFLRQIALDNYLLLDESHSAAGDSNTGAYLKSIVKGAKGVTFASATFAKRPDSMPLYALKTAMGQANIPQEELIAVIEKGGVPLQEIMSRALTESGQMVRRERDMSDVVTDWITIDDPETATKARQDYDKTIGVFNEIVQFQKKYIEPLIDRKNVELAYIASTAEFTQGTKNFGVDNVPFVSKTYNYTRQLLLALKVDAVVSKVDELIRKGMHPVIALENTMESAYKDDYSIGEEITVPSFSASLLKGLDSVMQYTERDADGEHVKVIIRPESLGKEGEEAYYKLRESIIKSTDGIFMSPVDAIISRLNSMGYSVGELTGRSTTVQMNEDGKYMVSKRNDKDKKKLAREFNNGKIDVLILNKSASTGISLHAGEKFGDKRQRAMVIAQPLSDINDYMQMIGRIDRTGQVHRGYYINLGLPVPAEMRFLMMLSTKLKSLNANTTTEQDGGGSGVDAPDFLNKYGDRVSIEYLRDNPDIYEKMGGDFLKQNKVPVTVSHLDSYTPQEDDARKITGRAALLTTDEQDAFYNDVIERYNTLIKYLDDTGTNELKIDVLPLRAKTINKKVVSKGLDKSGKNIFGSDSVLETVEMDVLKKPMKSAEVRTIIKSINGDKRADEAMLDFSDRAIDELNEKERKENERYQEALVKLNERIEKKKERINASQKLTPQEKVNEINKYETDEKEKTEKVHQNALGRMNEIYSQLSKLNSSFSIGKTYFVPDDIEAANLGRPTMFASPAIFCGFKTDKEKLTPSTVLAVFAVLDGRRKVEIQANQYGALQYIHDNTIDNIDAARQTTIDNWDSQIPSESRTTGFIMTGNILQGIEDVKDDLGNYPGKLVSFTDIDGNVRDGILMPATWEESKMNNSGEPISLYADKLIVDKLNLESKDGKVVAVHDYRDHYHLIVPKTKKEGGKFFENEDILSLTDGAFYQRRGQFRADIVGDDKMRKVIDILAGLGVKVKSSEESQANISSENQSLSDTDLNRTTTEAVTTLLSEAGVNVEMVSEEEANNASEGQFRTSAGIVYGYAKNGKIYLNAERLNPNTPIHEYTHLWDNACQQLNPELWRRGKELMKQTSVWREVMKDNNYASIRNDEDAVASEVHSRLTGRSGAELLEKLANEGNTATEKITARGLIGRLRKWLKSFWKWTKDTFTNWTKEEADKVSLEDFVNMPIGSLVQGINPNEPHPGRKIRQSDGFYSNALRAILGIKMEKATPQQWKNMIAKEGGLKAGEDKWLGLSEWLDSSGKKTLTKDEVIEYINEHSIQIEETDYSEMAGRYDDYLYKEDWVFSNYLGNKKVIDAILDGTRFSNGKYGWIDNYYKEDKECEEALNKLNSTIINALPINNTRLSYTTKGLKNKREIALTIPTIESWNEDDDIHFGDAGEGRAIAWVRFGDAETEDGKKVLFIDEIQSKRHQEGREKGYRSKVPAGITERARKAESAYTNARVNFNNRIKEIGYDEAVKEMNAIRSEWYNAESALNKAKEEAKAGVPAAPFEKNWHELAIKRMLRLAAEEGYGYVAWTTGEQQAKRYDLSKVIETIDSSTNDDGSKRVSLLMKDSGGDIITFTTGSDGMVTDGDFAGNKLSDVVGKELADRIMSGEELNISGADIAMPNHGMNNFYDSILPKFMDKYGKKWGTKTEDMFIPGLEGKGVTAHAVPVTDTMRESVMQGQPMFDIRNEEETQRRIKTFLNSNSIKPRKLFREQMLDRFTPIAEFMKEGARRGASYGEMEDAYVAAGAIANRSQGQILYYQKDILNPLQKAITGLEKAFKDSGLSKNWNEAYNDVIEFLYALHAPERNRHITLGEIYKAVVNNTSDRTKELLRSDRVDDVLMDICEVIYGNVFEFGSTPINVDRYGLENTTEVVGALRAAIKSANSMAVKIAKSEEGNNRSGMTDEEAREIVEKFNKPEFAEQIEELRKRRDAASKFVRDMWLEYEVIDDNAYRELSEMYKEYIPLRGWDETEDIDWDAVPNMIYKGSEMVSLNRHAKGRTSRSDNPFAYLDQMAISAIIRGNRNRARVRLFNYISKNAKIISDIAKIPQTYIVEDADGTQEVWFRKPNDAEEEMGYHIVSRGYDNRFKWHTTGAHITEKVVPVNIDGNTYFMEFEGDFGLRTAKAIKEENVSRIEWNVWKRANRFVGFMKSAMTSANPKFWIKNFRDIPYAAFIYHLNHSMGSSLKYDMLLLTCLAKVAGLKSGLIKDNSETGRMFREFEENGGATGWTRMKDINTIKNDLNWIRARYGEGGALKVTAVNVGNFMKHLAESLSSLSEITPRFAAYVAGREHGMSPEYAAKQAREITVDFSQKGTQSSFWDTLYVFFTPTINAADRTISEILKHPVKAGMDLALFTALSYVLAVMAVGDDDDDEEDNPYDNISDYNKFTNWLIKDGDHFISIPKPQNIRGIMNLAEQTLDVQRERKTFERAMLDWSKNIIADFSPLDWDAIDLSEGGAGNVTRSLEKFLMPTVARPITELINNEDFMGHPIYRENSIVHQPTVPQWKFAGRKTPEAYVNAARWLNTFAGGTDYRSARFVNDNGEISQSTVRGLFDINPSWPAHIIEGYLGGFADIAHEVASPWRDENNEVNYNNIPVLNVLLKEPFIKKSYAKYFDIRDEVEIIKSDISESTKAGNYPEAIITKKINARKVMTYEAYEKVLRKLRSNLADATTPEQVELIQTSIDRTIDRMVNAYYKADDADETKIESTLREWYEKIK